MKPFSFRSAAVLAAVSIATAPAAQEAAPPTAPAPAQEESAVAARVDGAPILESAVDAEILQIVAEQTQGRMLPPEQLQRVRSSLFRRVLDRMIDDRLLDAEAERLAVGATPEECRGEMARNLDNYVRSTGLPRTYLAERIEAAEGKSLEEFITARSEEPRFLQSIVHGRLLRRLHPEETAVTDAEIEAEYASSADRFHFPTVVRARHVLIGTETLVGDDALPALRAKAASVRDLARAEGADFAELAREHSTGPSGPEGGDLGYFPREQMVAPFAEAAFAMEVGAVSDVVETQFGYHVILVVDRREERTLSLAEASPLVRAELEGRKLDGVRDEVVAGLREGAQIEYAAGQQG